MSHFLRWPLSLFSFLVLLQLSSCALIQKKPEKSEQVEKVEKEKGWAELEEKYEEKVEPSSQATPVAPPAFLPVSEELSPLKTKIMSLSVRDQPLKDVLYTIAATTGLNLIVEKGVDPEITILVTLNDVTAEEALTNILSSVNYFYSTKGNILTVKAMETRIFEFGVPSIIQDYTVNVGGDIIGGALGKDGSAKMKGSVTQKIELDKMAYKLWESIENNLTVLLGIVEEEVEEKEIEVEKAIESESETKKESNSEKKATAEIIKPRFSVNRIAGTIIVTASKQGLDRVHLYIEKMKKILNRQVMIEARIVEVQLSDALKYGIDWQYFSGQSSQFGPTRFGEVADSLPNFNAAVTRGSFNSVLHALEQHGDIDVLSNPRVSILNGQTALLSVGRKIDFVSEIETTINSKGNETLITYTVKTDSILSGIIFGIVPYIHGETGEISLTITPIISDLVKLEDKRIGTVGESAIELSLPTVDLRELSTTVKVKDKNMVIIGGLIQKETRVEDTGVPFLSKIPFIGGLFKSHNKAIDRTEIVIILRPVLING